MEDLKSKKHYFSISINKLVFHILLRDTMLYVIEVMKNTMKRKEKRRKGNFLIHLLNNETTILQSSKNLDEDFQN